MSGRKPTPVTPQDVREGRRMGRSEEAEFESHVIRINEMLADGGRTYACSLFSSGLIQGRVVRAFDSWDVRQVGDFRDGDYLEFSEPR